MQPCSREMQGLNPLLDDNNNHHKQQQQQQQIQMNSHNLDDDHMDPLTSHQDDFLKQILSALPNSSSTSFWPDLNPPTSNSHQTPPSPLHNVTSFPYDDHATLASKFRNHQITATSSSGKDAAAALMLQQQLLLMSRAAADSGLLQMPLSLAGAANDVVDGTSSFKSPNPASDGSVEALYNGFTGSLQGTAIASNQTHHFQHPQGQGGSNPMQGQSFGGSGGGGNRASGGGNPAQPKQRVRARRGQATDPHSIAERLRRERIAERMKALQELVPNANKTDKASMLDEIIDYVKFLQLQVKVLSMSRLGGAAAVAPLVGEGGGDCVQANSGGAHRRNQTTQSPSTNDNSLTMTEHQVAKLMEEDMGSAMQYLLGKGLCLMPISLATAISTRNPLINNPNQVIASNGDGPSSPGISVLTVQSGNVDAVKDAASVSKP